MHNHSLSCVDYFIERTVAPAPLITLDEAKAHLEIDHTDRDAMITGLCAAASEMIDGPEAMAGKAIAAQTWVYKTEKSFTELDLPIFPVQAISSVAYLDDADAEQSLSVNDFIFYSTNDWTRIDTVSGFSWPALSDRKDAIQITLSAGMSEVPQGLKQAALLMVGHWYANREAASELNMNDVPYAATSLINLQRKGWVAA